MNTYFEHGGTANGFYNSAAAAEAHQAVSAYRSFSQSALSLMPGAAYAASSSSNLRASQSSVSGTNDANATSNYVDAACKLYEGNQAAANQAAAAAAAAFKSECSIKSEPNGFKAPEHQMSNPWQSSLRPSPSSGTMPTPDMRFDAAAAAACSRSVSDAWSACCSNGTMSTSPMGPGANFYPWMAIAGKLLLLLLLFWLDLCQ